MNTTCYSKYFKNYNFINDFCFNQDDYISELLIKNYQTSVYNVDMNNKQEVNLLKKIDNIMYIYIIDSDFFQAVQKQLGNIEDNSTQDLNTILIDEYQKFSQHIFPVVKNSRWI